MAIPPFIRLKPTLSCQIPIDRPSHVALATLSCLLLYSFCAIIKIMFMIVISYHYQYHYHHHHHYRYRYCYSYLYY